MVLVGLGNGWALGPLTVAGVAGVSASDQGAASGVVNVAHQMGGTVGLSVLVVVFASAQVGSLSGAQELSTRIGAALTGAGVMLVLGLLVARLLVLPGGQSRRS